jgi:Glycosyl transferase 4-like
MSPIDAAKSKVGSVLMLIENAPFPFDRRMRHCAEALRGDGYNVSVICPRGKEFDQSAYAVIDDIKIYRYPPLFQASGKLGYFLEYGWALFCLGALSLMVWLRDGFDIIHCANPPDLMFLIASPFKLLGKR